MTERRITLSRIVKRARFLRDQGRQRVGLPPRLLRTQLTDLISRRFTIESEDIASAQESIHPVLESLSKRFDEQVIPPEEEPQKPPEEKDLYIHDLNVFIFE